MLHFFNSYLARHPNPYNRVTLPVYRTINNRHICHNSFKIKALHKQANRFVCRNSWLNLQVIGPNALMWEDLVIYCKGILAKFDIKFDSCQSVAQSVHWGDFQL